MFITINRLLANIVVRRGWQIHLPPYTLEYIDPNLVTRVTGDIHQTNPGSYHLEHTTTPSTGRKNIGKIKSGNWDKIQTDFNQLTEYKSIKNRYKNNMPWKKTRLYKIHKQRINQGYKSYGCKNICDLYKKLNKIDDLFKKIKNEGYKTQIELSILNDPYNEVRINISRNGQFIFNEQGRHRLSIAKIIGLDKIPVLVSWYHKEYFDRIKKK